MMRSMGEFQEYKRKTWISSWGAFDRFAVDWVIHNQLRQRHLHVWMKWLARIGAWLMIVVMILFMLWRILFFSDLSTISEVLGAMFSAVCTKLLIDVIAVKVGRVRPFVKRRLTPSVRKDEQDPSFPSNHAGGAFALAGYLAFHFSPLAPFLYVIAVGLAVSRVFALLHYPSDLVAGAGVGTLVAFLVSLFLS